ncbi:MAG: hypothetical protein QW815_02160 [Nitrososphaerota archaeon]
MKFPKLAVLTVGAIVAASLMIIYIHPLQLAILAALTAILALLLRKGGRAEPGKLYYEMREEDGLLHLVIQSRERVAVEVVGNTVRIVGSGVREFIRLPCSGILKNLQVVNNVVTAVITPINPKDGIP